MSPTIDATSLIENVGAAAADIDAGHKSPRPHIAALGYAGLLDLGIQDLLDGESSRNDLRDPAALIASLAGECMSTALAIWSHRVVLDYFARGHRSRQTEEVFIDLRAGRRLGANAVAPSRSSLKDQDELRVRATPDGKNWILTGFVPWAANLYPDAVVVLAARTSTGDITCWVDAAALDIRPSTGLFALGGTESGDIRFNCVRVGPEQVLNQDLRSFSASFRPSFLTLQSALGIGLAQRSLTETERALGKGNRTAFVAEVSMLRSAATEHYERWDAQASNCGAEHIGAYLNLSLEGLRLAGRITRVEATLAGTLGHRLSSGASRRFREAAVLPLTPLSEEGLLQELNEL